MLKRIRQFFLERNNDKNVLKQLEGFLNQGISISKNDNPGVKCCITNGVLEGLNFYCMDKASIPTTNFKMKFSGEGCEIRIKKTKVD